MAKPNSLMNINIANVKAFQKSIRDAMTKVDDLKTPFRLISNDFYISQKAIFALKGPGGYQDLNPRYKIQKERGDRNHQPAPAYPILRREGRLELSVTQPSSPEAIRRISSKALVIGTAVPYGIFHNSDEPRTKIPQRKFVFIGPESREFGKGDQFGGRPVRWTNIIKRYVDEVLASKKGGK
jgi:phage gpG-like protein